MNNERKAAAQGFFCSYKGILTLFAALLIFFILSLRFGAADMTTREFFRALFRTGNETDTVILYSLRLPRAVGCVLCGVGLSVSGVILQSVTDNELAGPSLIGVNQGAGFAVVFALALFPGISAALPLISFTGALGVTGLILLVSSLVGTSKSAFVLSGVAIGAVFSALISFFTLIDEDVLTSYHAFSVGSCAGLNLGELWLPAVMIAAGLVTSLVLSRQINALALGDFTAHALGVRVKLVRFLAVVCSSVCAAAVISFAGLLGFVGLIVPNLARKLVGNSTAFLISNSALMGGITVLCADLVGRVLLAPTEIPVGITMACIGAPVFLAILLGKGRRHE